MNMGPDIWGPHGWKFLHFVTIGYPENPTENEKKKYKNFFTLIKTILPCGLCAFNYKTHLQQHPLTDEIMSNKNKLISWGIKMHNLVNIDNNSKVYSDDEAIKHIIKEKACQKERNINFEYLLIPVIVIALIIIVYYKNLKKD
tara:strand:+ start:410 stop:838 length:429 start_codon:yes stop_codon:yes gene_type:complete